MLREQLRKMLDAIYRKTSKPAYHSGPADNDNKTIARAMRTLVRVVHSAINSYKAQEQQNRRLDQWKRIVEIATFVVVAFYTTVTYFQLLATRDAIRVATEANQLGERQARISLRAWVLPGKTEFVQLETGKMITIRVEATNTGRTPAVNSTINGTADSFLVSQPRPPIKRFDKRESRGKTTIRPDRNTLLTLDLFPLTELILKEIRSGQRIIRVYGTTWYDDVFDHPHWMKFCKEYEEFSQGFVTCDAEGDEIDNDPE